MKKYLLFVYDNYYPSGGMTDYVGDFDTVAEALDRAKQPAKFSQRALGYYEIVEHETMKYVEKNNGYED